MEEYRNEGCCEVYMLFDDILDGFFEYLEKRKIEKNVERQLYDDSINTLMKFVLGTVNESNIASDNALREPAYDFDEECTEPNSGGLDTTAS